MPKDPSLSQAKTACWNARQNAQNQSCQSQNVEQPENHAGPSRIQLPEPANPQNVLDTQVCYLNKYWLVNY